MSSERPEVWVPSPAWSVGADEVSAVINGAGVTLAPLPDGSTDRGLLLGRAAFVLSELTTVGIAIHLCAGRSALRQEEIDDLRRDLRNAEAVRRGQVQRASRASLFARAFDATLPSIDAVIEDLRRQLVDEDRRLDELDRLRKAASYRSGRSSPLSVFVRVRLAPAFTLLTGSPFKPTEKDGRPTNEAARFAVAFFAECLGVAVNAKTVKNAMGSNG